MLIIRNSLAILICTLFLMSMATDAIASRVGTIVAKDGTQYGDANYKVDNFYKVIRLKFEDGTKKNISFSQIDAILNEDGDNIAAKLLGPWYKPLSKNRATRQPANSSVSPPTTNLDIQSKKIKSKHHKNGWKGADSKIFEKMRKKTWNFAFRWAGNYGLPDGEYYDGVNSGIGFEGDFLFAITNDVALRFSVSQAGINVDNYFYSIEETPGFTLIDQESKLGVMRYFLSGQHVDHPDQYKAGETIVYAWTGLGAVIHKMEGTALIREDISGDLYAGVIDETESKFATTFGGGIILLLTPGIGVDGSLSMDFIHGIVTAFIFDFKLGFIALF